jgi:hypothetical protein
MPRRASPAAWNSCQQTDASNNDAYVALLYGDRSEFFLYALLLGHHLSLFDATRTRVLLLAIDPGAAGFGHGSNLRCLQRLWSVQMVELVDAAIADLTASKRHRYVFTKLQAFGLDFARILFFDLDILLRQDPSPLFDVPAPAGMYHGSWDRTPRAHGSVIPLAAFGERNSRKGCVNAGVLRIDPAQAAERRERELKDMLRDVQRLTWEDASNLPEQYFLVHRFKTWRHLHVGWNCEVYPKYYIDEDGAVIRCQLPQDWNDLGDSQETLSRSVKIFHFSGEWMHPWWFVHLSPAQGGAAVRRLLHHRDPRGLAALAIEEWLQGLEDMQDNAAFGLEDREQIKAHVDSLQVTTRAWWHSHTQPCISCFGMAAWNWSHRTYACEECDVAAHLGMFFDDDAPVRHQASRSDKLKRQRSDG